MRQHPIDLKEIVDGIVHFTFQKQRYRMQLFCEFTLHRESDNLSSVKWDDKLGFYTIITKEDFGGCGKDALKPVVVPFDSWLAKYTEKV